MIAAVVSLLFAGFSAWRVLSQSEGSNKVKDISGSIKSGAMTFLNKEYKYLSVFVAIVALILFLVIGGASTYLNGAKTAITFIVGAIFSALAGNVGMRIATSSNSRTAWAAKDNLGDGLKIAFSSGAVMGATVVGLGLLGISGLYYWLQDASVLFGFGFGASSIALFARVGGGIYTKAADVGADLVGKVEEGIPEDDPRNPASIADNVGDNVGDVAGMGADLFESYVDSIIATMVIGVTLSSINIVLPLLVAGVGILASIAGSFLVRAKGKDEKKVHGVLNKGVFGAAILMALGTFLLTNYLFSSFNYFYAIVAGLASGVVIGLSTEYYTSDQRRPTQWIAKESKTGSATNILAGLSVGMKSTLIPVLTVSAAIFLSYYLADIYGIGLAAVGMLSTLGMTLATDSYGPVADNAAGIAEMSGLGKKVRERAEALDAVGNTTAAIGKGFAIGSAALTALALFSAYSAAVKLQAISLTEPNVVIGLFIGALLPFLFSSNTLKSVGKTASQMIEEVRRQFKQYDILEGEDEAKPQRCVEISTKAALREMITPSLLAIITPLAVGLILGVEALGGLLAGSIATGFLLAVMMANAGGAWDNAKKYVEAGNLGGKGSEVHKATVVGDTVGDPFKDTSGPSLNILIKLMSIVALVFVPILA